MSTNIRRSLFGLALGGCLLTLVRICYNVTLIILIACRRRPYGHGDVDDWQDTVERRERSTRALTPDFVCGQGRA